MTLSHLVSSTDSKRLPRIQQNRHWPFVHKFHSHRFLETPSFAAQSELSNPFYEQFIEMARSVWRCCSVEGRPLAAPYVSVERKLRYRQHAPAHIGHAPIHFLLRACLGIFPIHFENPQANNFFGEVDGIGLHVVSTDG